MLATAPAYRGGATSGAVWTVGEGALGAGAADAFSNLSITFKTGSRLAVAVSGDAAMPDTGVVLTGDVAFENGVGLSFLDPDGAITEATNFSVPVFTATPAVAAAALAKLPASGRARFGDVSMPYRLRSVADGDNVVCYADFYKGGLLIIME